MAAKAVVMEATEAAKEATGKTTRSVIEVITIMITPRTMENVLMRMGAPTLRSARDLIAIEMMAIVTTLVADGLGISNGGLASLAAKQPTVLVNFGIQTLLSP
jgi:hypothetical protein